MRYLGPSECKWIAQRQAGMGAKPRVCDLSNRKKILCFLLLIRPWASGRKTLSLVHLWTPSTLHMLGAQYMLGDWIIVRFLGCEQTFEEVESIRILHAFQRDEGNVCSSLYRPGSLMPLLILLGGRFPAPCYFGLANTHSSLKRHVKCHLPAFLIWSSCTLISTVLCTDHQGTNCLAVSNYLLAWLSLH